jgi:hypothetical protein
MVLSMLSGRTRTRLVLGAIAVVAACALVIVSGLVTDRNRVPVKPVISRTTAGLPRRAATPGADLGGLFISQSRGLVTATQVNAQLSAMAAAGVRDARADAVWAYTEPRPRVFDWSYDNMVASELAAHGITWLADIDLAPAWATGHSGLYITASNGKPAVPPPTTANYGAYANYAAQVEARYHPSGVEIWNEEDLWAFWYHPNPGAYGKLFDVAQQAVKRVNPGALVIAGGISQFSPHFLAQVINADPSFHPDGLAFHGYYETPAQDLAHFEVDADQADALGLRVPIYADEYGWQTGRHAMPGGTWAVSAAQRRSYMAPMLKGFTQDPRFAESDWFQWAPSGPWSLSDSDTAAYKTAVELAADAAPSSRR